MTQTLTPEQIEYCNNFWLQQRKLVQKMNDARDILGYFQDIKINILPVVNDYVDIFIVATNKLKYLELEFTQWLKLQNIDYNTRDMNEDEYAILHGLNFNGKTSDTTEYDIPKYINSVFQKNQYEPKY